MKHLSIPCLLLSALFLTGCAVTFASNSYSSTYLSSGSGSESSKGDDEEINFDYKNALYNKFFNPESDVKITIKMSNNALKHLAQYGVGSFTQQEMYHPCSFKIEIDDKVEFDEEEIGIRMKGNTSKNPNFVDNDGHFNALSHFKVAFNKNFAAGECDYYTSSKDSETLAKNKKRKFADMKKIDLKWNRNFDNTFTKEAYAKDCYRDAGVVAQRMNLVCLTLQSDTDEINEIYQVIETVDGSSLKKYFGSEGGDGNLYKGLYARANLTTESISGTNLNPESETNEWPTYPLKTNDDGPTYDHSLFKKTVRILNKVQPVEDAKIELDECLAIDNILRYCAVAWVVGNPDDLRNNSNNTYFYFHSSNEKMYIIPYDDDRVFGILNNWPVDMSTLPADSTRAQGMSHNSGGKVWINNPLFWHLIISESDSGVKYSDNYPVIEEYKTRYEQYVREYSEKYLDVNRFQEFTNKFVNAPSKDIADAGPENQTFAYYSGNKLNNLFK